jgi:hypothetical protein
VAKRGFQEAGSPLATLLFNLIALIALLFMGIGCSTLPPDPPQFVNACSGVSPQPAELSSDVLEHYDAAVAMLLDEATQHPTSNAQGQVVWGTRYYLESLLVAYEATGNLKYINSFIQTANIVLGLKRTLQVPDVADPSDLDDTRAAAAPQRTVTGWPTSLGTLGQLIKVPATNGKVSLYAQTLWPTPSHDAGYLQILQSSSGGLALRFVLAGTVWQSYPVSSEADLESIAAQPVVYTVTLGRIRNTGFGLPVPGLYPLDFPLSAIWHGEQTAGILLPFLRFLLLAKQQPWIADPKVVVDWRDQVVGVAKSYENDFVEDGKGGLILTNAYWVPSPWAGLPVETDYINAEISMRMLLSVLTSDPHELLLAKGLLVHESANLPLSSNSWILMKYAPDYPSWSNKTMAPHGGIWDSFSYDTSAPETATEGGFFAETLQIVSDLGLGKKVGLTEAMCEGEKQTFQQYLRLPPSVGGSLIRMLYPNPRSQASDPPVLSDVPVDAARYLQPVIEDPSFVCDDWNWMLKNGITREQGVGHVLLDWARAEAEWRRLPPGQCTSQ